MKCGQDVKSVGHRCQSLAMTIVVAISVLVNKRLLMLQPIARIQKRN